ncbi:MAG TPA: hypothetical protein VJ812_09400 [Gemmatimonadaceae bacterium]|jgi:hypothetical protein|nr:hypothetical protein [Gemmatimonadaceae bacterium]
MFSRVLPFLLLLAAMAPATVQPQSKSEKKLRSTMTKSNAQLRSVELGLLSLDRAMASSSSVVSADDKAHYQWLIDVRARITARHAELREAVRAAEQAKAGAPANASLVERMEQMNAQLAALRKAVQTESRRFQTLSNASKARHDAAMNAIRNMKG